MNWKDLLLLDYAYIYSLSLVMWRFLKYKLKNVKAFALTYTTGAHLIFLEMVLVLSLPQLVSLVLVSYLLSVYLSLSKTDLCMEPYLYLAWATAFAFIIAMG